MYKKVIDPIEKSNCKTFVNDLEKDIWECETLSAQHSKITPGLEAIRKFDAKYPELKDTFTWIVLSGVVMEIHHTISQNSINIITNELILFPGLQKLTESINEIFNKHVRQDIKFGGREFINTLEQDIWECETLSWKYFKTERGLQAIQAFEVKYPELNDTRTWIFLSGIVTDRIKLISQDKINKINNEIHNEISTTAELQKLKGQILEIINKYANLSDSTFLLNLRQITHRHAQ